MRHRSSGSRATMGVRAALAVLLAAVMLPVGAVPAMGAADDDFPGVPIMASPIVGTLDEDTDFDDVFSVYLNAGQSITAALKGPGDADFDLYLYPPGSTDMAAPIDGSTWKGSVELLNYTAETSGVYYLEVYAYDGSGSYTLAWRKESEATGLYVTPLEGIGRIETAITAARYAPGSEYVIIATARSFPDALGGSALAGVLEAPILLTEPTVLPDAVATEIDNIGATKAIILGGTGAVSAGVEGSLKTLLGAANVERIGGLNRYETASNIADRVFDEIAVVYENPGPYIAFVATGEQFPDALAASSWGSAGSVPFFLVHPGTNPAALVASLQAANVNRIVILGGTGAVPQAIQTATEGAGITTSARLAGLTRYETSAAIAEAFGVDLTVAVTTGQDFPDALAGGAVLGLYDVPIVLTRPTLLETPARGVLEAHADTIEDVFFLGGTGAVSVPVRRDVRVAIAGSLPVFASTGSTDARTLSAAPALDSVKSNRR